MKKTIMALALVGTIGTGAAGYTIGDNVATKDGLEQMQIQKQVSNKQQMELGKQIHQLSTQQKEIYMRERQERLADARKMIHTLGGGVSLDTTSRTFIVSKNDGEQIEGEAFDSTDEDIVYQIPQLEPYGLEDVEPGDYITLTWTTEDYNNDKLDEFLMADILR